MSIESVLSSVDQNKMNRDTACKNLMKNRQLLARLLKGFVPEYKDCDLKEIEEKLIEPDSIRVSSVALERDRTEISGIDTEDGSETEGTVHYDLYFRAMYPGGNGEYIGLLINLEFQNDYYPGYPLEKRGYFYAARILTSQLKEINKDTNYGNLKKVYSIWLCIGDNLPKKEMNTATLYQTEKHDIIGHVEKDRKIYDLIAVLIIRIGEKIATDNEAMELFAGLFGKKLSKQRRLEFLKERGIRTTADIIKGVDDMCNLSESIYQDGIKEGVGLGMQQALDILAKLTPILKGQKREHELEGISVENLQKLAKEFHLG